MNMVRRAQRKLMPFQEALGFLQYRSLKGRQDFRSGTARLYGEPVSYSDAGGFLHSVDEIFYGDVYRFEADTTTPRIIDAGANIGLSVIYFKRLYPDARILAYEPDHAIFAILQRNAARFRDVELREAAAWTEDTTLTFYSEGSLAGSSEVDYHPTGGKATTVKAERLRDRLRDGPVDFLKIDIEGAENSVMFDIEDELDNVRHLFFEYHSVVGKAQQLGDLLNLVRRKGFRFIINGPHGSVKPFIWFETRGFDLQLNVSCFRVPGAE